MGHVELIRAFRGTEGTDNVTSIAHINIYIIIRVQYIRMNGPSPAGEIRSRLWDWAVRKKSLEEASVLCSTFPFLLFLLSSLPLPFALFLPPLPP